MAAVYAVVARSLARRASVRVMDVRRQVPRTDAVLADPAVVVAAQRLGRSGWGAGR
jgi:hypothetical protein